ncbi:conserved hypothetical protein [Ricinus communis]|uniref:Uncharacterized protein n=1 Tax=Ricinus communis TaxID=3988 RepID=B9SBQ7_RICCO|nr:conserved hypothetical protein [Ricinus communis]
MMGWFKEGLFAVTTCKEDAASTAETSPKYGHNLDFLSDGDCKKIYGGVPLAAEVLDNTIWNASDDEEPGGYI